MMDLRCTLTRLVLDFPPTSYDRVDQQDLWMEDPVVQSLPDHLVLDATARPFGLPWKAGHKHTSRSSKRCEASHVTHLALEHVSNIAPHDGEGVERMPRPRRVWSKEGSLAQVLYRHSPAVS